MSASVRGHLLLRRKSAKDKILVLNPHFNVITLSNTEKFHPDLVCALACNEETNNSMSDEYMRVGQFEHR